MAFHFARTPGMRSPLIFLTARTLFVLVFAGLFVFVLARDLPQKISGIQNAHLHRQTALLQVQATADLKHDAKIFLPLISKIEAITTTEEQAFEVTKSIRAVAARVFVGPSKVERGMPVLSADVSGLRTVPFTIEGEGNIDTVKNLLRELRTIPTVIRIISISVNSVTDVEHDSHIVVSIEYFLR